MQKAVALYATMLLVVAGCSHHDLNGESLFSMNLTHQSDLDAGKLTDNIRQSFADNGYALSEDTDVKVILEQQKWMISDKTHKQEYSVVKENNSLNIYSEQLNFEAIKENRKGLDYRKDPFPVFVEIDRLINRWVDAQQREQYGVSSATKGELRKMGRAYFSELVKALQGDNAFHRQVAAAALGFSDDLRAIPYLLDVLEKGEEKVRLNAALGIGQIEFSNLQAKVSQRIMATLVKSLQNEPQDETRSMVAFAISQIVRRENDYGALSHLLQAIGDKYFKVRNHVVIALGKIGHPEGAKAIIANTLDDEQPGVRYSSLRALGQINDPDVDMDKLLVRKLRDTTPVVAGAAYYLLKYRTGEDFGPNPKKWEEWAGIEQPKTVKKTEENKNTTQ